MDWFLYDRDLRHERQMRHWFIFLTVFQGNDKGTCVFILNFEHIDYILKVFNLIMWNLVFRLCCKSIQFFNLVSVFLKLKLCKFIVLLQLFVTSRIFLVTLSRYLWGRKKRFWLKCNRKRQHIYYWFIM